jgi:uncharacterized membrane protein SpoIIM required for sporulation
MTERFFIRDREAAWQNFESLIKAPKKAFAAEAARFPAMLRSLTGDLNTARAHGFNPVLIDRLDRLVFDGNQILGARQSFSLSHAARFLVKTFPQSARGHWRSFAACCLVFYGTAFFSAFLCVYKAPFAKIILGEKTMSELEEMYDRESDTYLTPRDVNSDLDMFAYYIYNNISITFKTFAGGVLLGIGSLFFLVYNALFLGAAAGYLTKAGYGETFFSFVAGHSAFELTGIVLGAQAGLLLGRRFFITKGLSRGASLRAAGKSAFPLLAGAAILDFLAAIIEAFWSPRRGVPDEAHYAAGVLCWLLLVCYLLFAGRRARAAR